MKTIHNVETGEIVERELAKEEMAQQVKDEKLVAAKEAAKEAREAAIAAVYDKLGLTPEEIALITQ